MLREGVKRKIERKMERERERSPSALLLSSISLKK